MNYYKQGDAANANKIKAAFEELGYDTCLRHFTNQYLLYFTIDGKISDIAVGRNFEKVVKSHPDYQELELPKPHYDIANFQSFDKVLVRYYSDDKWKCGLFSHLSTHSGAKFVCVAATYVQCIPFNDDTKHLLGTTDMCDEQYINW